MPVHTELFYEHEIYTECVLYNDLPTQCRYFTPAQFSTNFSGTDRANNLSVIHFNARSLKANLNKIKDTLRELEYKFHIIAISETWFKENNWDGNEVTNFHDAFLGYKLYCNSRNNKTGGGVAIVVCESLLRNCESPNICLRNVSYAIDECFESIFIELQISKHSQINVGCIYRAPNTSISKFNENLSYILGNLTSKVVYICGDFNIDLLHCEEQTESKHFVDQMFSSGLYPLITRPTRITGTTATIIDNIFCSELCRNKMCGIVLSDATDHMPIFVLCDNSTYVTNNNDQNVKYNRTLDDEALSKFEQDLSHTNWETVLNECNPNLAYLQFMQILSNTYNNACPVKIRMYTNNTKRKEKPWISRGLKNDCIKKNNLYLAFLKRRSLLAESRYKNYKNKLTKILRIEKKNYYRQKLEECKANTSETWKILNTIIGKRKSENLSYILGNLTSKVVYICGDFNIDLLHCEEQTESKHFVDQMFSSGLYPLITRPTRITGTTATIIDNIFCSELCRNKMCGIVLSDATDHMPIFVLCDNSTYVTNNNDQNVKYNRTLDDEALSKFEQDLSHTNWETVLNECNPNLAYLQFMQILSNTYNNACPVKIRMYTNNTKRKEKPWISRGLKNDCIKKNNLYLAFLKRRSLLTESRYKNYKNKLTKILRIEKKNYYRQKLEECKANTSETWKILNTIIGKRKSEAKYSNEFIVDNDRVTLDNEEIANHFNNFFVNIGTILSNSIEPCQGTQPTDFLKNQVSDSMYMYPVTEKEVSEIVSGCKSKTSYGHDEISMTTVKHVIKQIVRPLTYIFNRSLITGIFPNDMKTAKVIPVFKSGDRLQFSNYRPISLLPQFSKILEKIFNKRLMSFIENHHVLTDGQYGFRSNHSTSLALTEFVEKVTSAIDKQENTIGVFIDLMKAFDTVDHKILLSKLQCYGTRGLALDWIKSYLANRGQYVCYNNSNSELKNIKCGVPQGSILGPVLFILYINDMCEVSTLLNIILFADDTSIFYSTRNIVDITCTVNNELEKLDIWFRVNKLSLNVNKTNFIMFTNKKQLRPTVNIVLNGKNIEQVSHTKFLGVIIDDNLTWREQIKTVETKVSKHRCFV